MEAFSYGAGSKEGSVYLKFDAFNSGNNWISEKPEDSAGTPIQIRCIDDLEFERWPDFIKIDVQGWEVEALRGMESLLSKRKPIIFCEVSDSALKSSGSNTHELGHFLQTNGYGFQLPVLQNGTLHLIPITLEAMEKKALTTLYFDILAFPKTNP